MPRSTFDLSVDQMRQLKVSCTDLYKILHFIFSANKVIERPVNSVYAKRIMLEKRFQRPSDYYNFKDEEVNICLTLRRGSFYSVACCGFTPEGVNLDFMTGSENEFSAGFNYYGRFSRNDFFKALRCWRYVVKQYINKKFDNLELF